MSLSPGPRKTAKLSESIHHQLNSYALAASAAGVSALALSQASQAKIVYTPAHVVLHARSNGHYYLDLNHDGVKDFTFSHGYFYSATTGFWGSIDQMQPYKSNGNLSWEGAIHTLPPVKRRNLTMSSGLAGQSKASHTGMLLQPENVVLTATRLCPPLSD
jgi:hypothetical protein